MSKIIYMPLEHIDGRYTVHLDRDIVKWLSDNDREYIRLYPDAGESTLPEGMFLNAAYTTKFKSMQMSMLAELYSSGIIEDGDEIFFSDIWFPGIEAIAYMNYFHKIDVKIKGILHAGSFTDTDFVRDMERWAKNFEDIIFDIADEIYIGSEFIKNDVIKKRLINPDKLVVTGLPVDLTDMSKYINNDEKEKIVIFNGRNCDEKQPWLFNELERRLGHKAKFINTQKENLSKQDYYKLLSKSKVVVSYALQENFGYGIAEAVLLGCIPVLPNRLVYPEFYNNEYLYDKFEESVMMVEHFLDQPPSFKMKEQKKEFNNKNIYNVWFKK